MPSNAGVAQRRQHVSCKDAHKHREFESLHQHQFLTKERSTHEEISSCSFGCMCNNVCN